MSLADFSTPIVLGPNQFQTLRGLQRLDKYRGE